MKTCCFIDILKLILEIFLQELEYCRGFIMDCNDEIKNLDKRTAEIMMKETKRFELEEMMEMKKRMRKEVDESPESGSM